MVLLSHGMGFTSLPIDPRNFLRSSSSGQGTLKAEKLPVIFSQISSI